MFKSIGKAIKGLWGKRPRRGSMIIHEEESSPGALSPSSPTLSDSGSTYTPSYMTLTRNAEASVNDIANLATADPASWTQRLDGDSASHHRCSSGYSSSAHGHESEASTVCSCCSPSLTERPLKSRPTWQSSKRPVSPTDSSMTSPSPSIPSAAPARCDGSPRERHQDMFPSSLIPDEPCPPPRRCRPSFDSLPRRSVDSSKLEKMAAAAATDPSAGSARSSTVPTSPTAAVDPYDELAQNVSYLNGAFARVMSAQKKKKDMLVKHSSDPYESVAMSRQPTGRSVRSIQSASSTITSPVSSSYYATSHGASSIHQRKRSDQTDMTFATETTHCDDPADKIKRVYSNTSSRHEKPYYGIDAHTYHSNPLADLVLDLKEMNMDELGEKYTAQGLLLSPKSFHSEFTTATSCSFVEHDLVVELQPANIVNEINMDRNLHFNKADAVATPRAETPKPFKSMKASTEDLLKLMNDKQQRGVGNASVSPKMTVLQSSPASPSSPMSPISPISPISPSSPYNSPSPLSASVQHSPPARRQPRTFSRRDADGDWICDTHSNFDCPACTGLLDRIVVKTDVHVIA
ncbi:uncharacterized protein BJ171DRAFT_580834 [Polychytrium aggregatum]|uniref:uncharacterized protein n=1 Tax=Polychytrium aggregatum TaxID=110093 RepID=UPI0022FDEAFF|nr:uncharacterized protein BJ171DRAFT_580834 [Polychytrium aggregatum]KAI9205659.1 hypothetical protein BJ171DRAFT_580834 [Polychytrium aggregatum]